QRYHQARLPAIRPEDQPQLFAVLGRVSDFKDPKKVLNRVDLEHWLRTNEPALKTDVSSWLPTELLISDREKLLDTLIVGTLRPIDEAIEFDPALGVAPPPGSNSMASSMGRRVP